MLLPIFFFWHIDMSYLFETLQMKWELYECDFNKCMEAV